MCDNPKSNIPRGYQDGFEFSGLLFKINKEKKGAKKWVSLCEKQHKCKRWLSVCSSLSLLCKNSHFCTRLPVKSMIKADVLFVFVAQARKVHTNATVAFVEVQEFNSTYSVEVAACTQAGSGMVSPRVLLFVPENSKPLTSYLPILSCGIFVIEPG